MSDVVETNMAKLTTWRRRWMTKNVTYLRDGVSVTLLATLGRADETQDGDRLVRVVGHRDFLVEVADMAAAGLVLPRVGDRITANFGPTTKTFEVLARSGEPEFGYTDGYDRVLRIHTKEVGT